MMKVFTRQLMGLVLGLGFAVPAIAAEDVVIVYDASGSMWGQIDGVSKIEIAREVMGDVVRGWDEGTNLGLIAYGHRRQGDCGDIETLISPGPVDHDAFIATVNAIRPVGKTPLTAAVQQAAELLSWRDNPATVILISDGLETCNADPCALSADLARQGLDFTTHVVGFDLENEAHESLACIAENTGGIFVPAGNADELHEALRKVKTAVEKPVPEPEAAPEPEPELPEVTLTGPDQVTAGSSFDFSWSNAIHPRDYVTIVPMGADEGSYASYLRVDKHAEGSLTAPSEPGLYELRYVLAEGARTLASVPVEVIEAEVTLTGPDQVTAGSSFDFSWSNAIHPRDYVTIVPMGADEGSYASYIRVDKRAEGSLTAPSEPGLYELRYVLAEGARTLASIPVEVIEAEVTLTGPDQVTAGSSFDFSWSNAIHPRDYVTIVPMGADEGSYASYLRVDKHAEGSLTAPSEPGLYELRYVLAEGARTLASIPVEVIEAEVGIRAPALLRAGSDVDISWSATIHPRDYITIVPMGTDEGSYASYNRAGTSTETRMKAPDEPGLYEIRYVLSEGAVTLARTPLEVVAADAPLDDGAGLSVQSSAAPGEVITVTWTGGGTGGDERVSLARKDQPDFSWIAAFKAGDEKTINVTMPDEPGLYEIRFLDIAGPELLGRSVVEVK